MVIVFFLWMFLFFIFVVIGHGTCKVFNLFSSGNQRAVIEIFIDEMFFTGFLTLSTILGFISIFIPIGNNVLIIVGLFTLGIFLLNFNDLKIKFTELSKTIWSLSKFDLIILTAIFLFLLSAVVHNITVSDTGLYHAQTIKWIRSYAVVPGLGNLHGRFGYNSMFFVISSLFTFQIKDVLLFPLNGICFVVMVIKLYLLFRQENRTGHIWMAAFYSILVILSVLLLTSSLNSPSPDVICSVLVIYSFVFICSKEKEIKQNNISFILLNLLVFSCVTFKLSSLFLILLIPLAWDSEIFKKNLISFIIGIVLVSPFLVRNYYLSGYLIYPYPAIDLFNVDWKIPYERAIFEKNWIYSWARIPGKSYTEVLGLGFSDWIIPWFRSIGGFFKIIVSFNLLTFLGMIIMVFKKDFSLAKIQIVIIINLLFWFILAPDPRFAFGFLFVGVAFTAAYFVKQFEPSVLFKLHKNANILFISALILVTLNLRSFPMHTLRFPRMWIISDPFEKAVTNKFSTNFTYMMPVGDPLCYFSDLPCVPYSIDNIVLRGKDFQDGFKPVTVKKSSN